MGASFNTFAWYRVQGAIIDGLRKQTNLPRRVWASSSRCARRAITSSIAASAIAVPPSTVSPRPKAPMPSQP